MATADQYASWIVQNQAKRGTPDFDTVAKAYEQAKLEDTKPVPSAGFSLKDLALSFGQGVGGGTQAITDIAGAGNVVSKGLTGLQQAAGEAMSPERQAEIIRRQEIKKKAEGNTLEEVKAVLGGFAEAPLQTLAQGAGSIVPMVLGTALMPAAAVPAAAARLASLGVSASTAAKVASSLPAATVGAMMGVGGQKGQDYETVKRELLERKIPEAEAERLAQKAAEYSLENAPRQLAGGAAGALAGGLGVESLVGRIGKKLPEVKGPSLKLPEPTVAQAIGKSTAAEALPEALQSAVSNVGTNVALNQAGVPTDLTQGVLANALNEALVGGILGAGASPLKLKEMRQQYVQDEFKGQQEYQKQQQEEIAANKKKINDELGMTQNPLGMLTPDDLGADLTKAVELHRASTGKPALTSFSLDDVVDALPGKDKAAESASLNAIIAAKTGYTNEVYTPTQIIEAAQAKNVETGTQGFDDFLVRTTGLSDPAQMSQPQLHAAVTALEKLPGFTSTQSLPEGLNATNYTPEQFTQAIDSLNTQMDVLNKDELTFKETTNAIETATGLKGSAVNALINDAARKGDVVTENKKVSVPSRTTPTGYGISEEIGAEQEQATSYEVRRGDEILDEHKTKESADQQVEGLNKLTAEEIKNIDESLKTEEAKISKAEKEVQRLILAGNRSTPEFKVAQDAYQQTTDEAFPRIAELKARKESYQTPLSVAPVGVTKVKPKSYVVRKGEGIQTVKQTREEAEQAIFADLADTDLQELAKKRSPALQKRVNAEIQRRAAAPVKTAPATAATPEQQTKLDQLKKDLPAMLERFGLKDVGLKIVDAIEGGADGSYQAKLIQIALSADKPIQTLRHEAIHALKELGFFTPQQWAALTRQANREWVQKYLKNKPYRSEDGKTMSRYEAYKTPGIASKDGLTEEDLIEEAIADAFADFDANKAPGGMLSALLNKLRNFFSALRSYLNGEGFQTYRDVFGKVEKGELKPTAPAVTGEAKKALPEAVSPLESYVSPQDAQDRVQRRLKRPAGVGAPINPRVKFTDENGKNPLVVGKITIDDWKDRVTTLMSKDEIKESRNWYQQLHDEFEPLFGADASEYALAWLLSQQRASPTKGFTDVLRAADIVAGKQKVATAGLNEKNLVLALKKQTPTSGVGAKLLDFIDSELGKKTRTIARGDKRARQPAAIDVWAQRDIGFVDPTMLKYIEKTYGADAAKQVKEDASVAGETQYEYGIDFYNDVAERLNADKFMGGKWTAREIQAVGWVTMQRAVGVQAEFVKDIIGANTRRVSIGLAPGEGSNMSEIFFGGKEIPTASALKVVDELAKISGVKVKQSITGVGAYLSYVEGSIQLDTIGSPEAVKDFMDMVGYAFQQTEVINTRPLRSGKNMAIDVMSAGLKEDADQVKFFSKFLDISPTNKMYYDKKDNPKSLMVMGFQPIVVDGVPGIRLLNFGGNWRQNHVQEIVEALNKTSASLNIQLESALATQVDLTKTGNDWIKEHNGNSYLDSLRNRGRLQEVKLLQREFSPKSITLAGDGTIGWGGKRYSLPTERTTGRPELITPEAKKSEQMRGIVSDETLEEIQKVLNTYKGKPKIEITDEQRSAGEKMLAPFLRKAEMIKPKFTKDVNEVADAVGGTVRSVGLKSMGRSVEKLWTDTENGLLGQPQGSDVLDLLRTTIVVDNESQIQPTIDLLTKKFGRVKKGVKRLFRIKDRFAKPLNGYRDILTNVQLPNGLVAEIQINVPTMITAKNTGHVVYAMSRVLPEESPERIRLEKLSGKFYEEAYEFSQKSKSPLTAGSARANVSGETGTSGLLAKTVEPSLSRKTGQESPKTQTVAPSGTLNIPASSKEPSIKESKKSLKTYFSTPEEAENAAYQKAPPTTPEFKRFFANSTIIEEGRPQVMYHASPNIFNVFRENKPIFISPDPKDAEFFGKHHSYGDENAPKNVNIYPLWVRAENPFDYENPEHVKKVQQGVTDIVGPRSTAAPASVKKAHQAADLLSDGDWTEVENDVVQQAIQNAGFDSFYVEEGGTKNLAVYSANQVKSVTGNTGEFGETKDMRFSLAAGPFNVDPDSKEKPISKWPRMEEPGGFEAKPSEYITVVRLASMEGLNNSNAASTQGLSTYLSMVDDNEVSAGAEASDSDTIYAYRVQVPENGFGDYQMARRNRDVGTAGVLTKAGREQAKYGGYWYSFPEGTDAELLGSISLGDARAAAAKIEREQIDQQPFSKAPLTDAQAAKLKGNFDTIGTNAGTAALNMAFDKSGQPIRYSLNKVKDEVDSLPNGAAINASINRIAPGREQKGYIERIIDVFKPQSVDALRQQFLNRYNQLGVYDRELAKTMGGAALLADSSAESAALMSDNAAAIATMACGIEGKGGVPVYDKGFTTISNANGEKGVLEILMPLAKRGDPRIYQTYQFWAGSIRGSRLITETDKNGNVVPRDHTYTQDEIDYAKELLVKYPEFKQVQEDWIKYNNGLMKYAVATGVLSPEKAAEFMKYSDYIPFYRQIDGETTVGPKLFQNISGVTPPKKLKGLKEGQEAPLADFLETIVRNTQSIIQSGMKNVAAQRAIGVASQLNMTNKRQDVSYAPGVVTILEKGKPVSYDVADQLFIDAVKSLNLPELPFLSFFAAPANLLRNLVTKDPGFMMANLMRDSLSAWVTSGAKMTPIASTIANFGRAIGGTDPVYIALRNAGVIGGYEFAAGVENSGTILGESLRRATGTQTGTEKALKPFTSLWRGLEKGTEASDAATRMAVYKSVMEQTGNEAEAIYRAMEVLNFNRKGNLAIVRILTAAVPFLNARMQGLDVFYRAAFGKMASTDAAAIQKSFFIRGATLMALTSMYWFLTHDDEEYLAQEQETRDNNWLFPSAGVRIPIPFEVGVLFKVVPERILEYMFGSDTGKDMADSFKRNLINTFAFNPIPQTVLPFVEARTNYSFYTMRDIVSQGMENVAKEYQVAPNTSEAAKKLGKILGESPIIVDHIMKGYTGSLGMYAIDLIDAVLFSNGDSPKPAKRFEQMPVIKRFALDKEAKGTVTSYYDLKNSVDEVVRTVNLMERTGNVEDMAGYVEKNAHLFGMRNYISSVEKQMKVMREAAIQIRSSDMSAEDKRDTLLAITQAQNAMTSNIREIKKTISN